jgi:hypothetical protein
MSYCRTFTTSIKNLKLRQVLFPSEVRSQVDHSRAAYITDVAHENGFLHISRDNLPFQSIVSLDLSFQFQCLIRSLVSVPSKVHIQVFFACSGYLTYGTSPLFLYFLYIRKFYGCCNSYIWPFNPHSD